MQVLKRPLDWQEINHWCILYAYNLSKTELKTVNSSELLLSVGGKKEVFYLLVGDTAKYKIGGHGGKGLELSLESEPYFLVSMEKEIKFH